VHDLFQEWLEYGCLEAAWTILLQAYDESLGARHEMEYRL